MRHFSPFEQPQALNDASAAFKRWLAARPDRDPLKRSRDELQADTVERLVDEYLPQLKA